MMTNKLIRSVAMIAVIASSVTLFAQGRAKLANVGEGTLTLKGKNYLLKNAASYETTVDGEEGIAVVLSGPTISNEKLNAAMKSEKAGEMPDFRKPYVKLEFTKAGVFKDWGAGAGDISQGGHRGNATGELKMQDGRVIGKASQPNETEGNVSIRIGRPLRCAAASCWGIVAFLQKTGSRGQCEAVGDGRV